MRHFLNANHLKSDSFEKNRLFSASFWTKNFGERLITQIKIENYGGIE
jgi:hypothetical protein